MHQACSGVLDPLRRWIGRVAAAAGGSLHAPLLFSLVEYRHGLAIPAMATLRFPGSWTDVFTVESTMDIPMTVVHGSDHRIGIFAAGNVFFFVVHPVHWAARAWLEFGGVPQPQE